MHLIEKLAYFDRERIPERVVDAKGAGAQYCAKRHGMMTRRKVSAHFYAQNRATVAMSSYLQVVSF